MPDVTHKHNLNNAMKEVIAVYVHKPEKMFKQFLMKSEVRLLLQMTKDLGKITIELVRISHMQYKSEFGK